MSPDSPPSRSNVTSPGPSTHSSPTGYADAARQPVPPIATLATGVAYLAMGQLCCIPTSKMTTFSPPTLSLAMARFQNPNSVVFNFQQLSNESEIEDILVQQIGPVVALSSRHGRQHHLLTEVLFKDKANRQKTIDTGIIVKNERILALPHVAAYTNLLKVNLYQLPVCDPTDLKDELFAALSYYGQVAQIRAYVSQKHHVCNIESK